MATAYQPIIPFKSLSANFWTYQDAVEWLLDFYGRTSRSARDTRLARRAVDNAYRDLVSNTSWNYYHTEFSLLTDANYRTGTVAYADATRLVTLTGGTWPANAAHGSIRFSNLTSKVESRVSDTQLRLLPGRNPGRDVDAGTTFEWFRDEYPLPLDCLAMADPLSETAGWNIPGLVYVEPDQLHRFQRWTGTVLSSEPTVYTISRDQRTAGYVIVMANPPSQARNYTFFYERAPRPLAVEMYADGTVDTLADSREIGGDDTAWHDDHVGCVLRLSGNGLQRPTSPYGGVDDGIYNPAWQTRLVASVQDAATLFADVAIGEARAGLRYVLSDPLDIDWQICGNYFQRLLEYHYAVGSNDHLQRAYKTPQVAQERRKAQAADQNRTVTVQPPPWAAGMPRVLFGDVTTDMDTV